MTGGHATMGGVEFQAKVASWFSAHILTERNISSLRLTDGIPVGLFMEAESPVDDIRVWTNSGNIFVNVKKSVTLTSSATSELRKVVDQFVRQWLVCSTGNGDLHWNRPIDPSVDCMVLAFDAHRTEAFYEQSAYVLERIHGTKSLQSAAQTFEQERTLAIWTDHIKHCWALHAGSMPSAESIAAILASVRLLRLDLDCAPFGEAYSILETGILEDRTQTDSAWNALLAEALRMGRSRGGKDREGLKDTLRKAGIALVAPPNLRAVIDSAIALTSDTLQSLSKYSHIALPEIGTPPSPFQINRACVSRLSEAAKSSSFLLIGAPGSGKSGVLCRAANSLIEEGHPTLVLAVDDWNAHSLADLSKEMNLALDIRKLLREWHVPGKPGILFIDALDASRGSRSDRVFQELIDYVKNQLPQWRVVASIRKFDLKYGAIYQDLFRGQPAFSDLVDPDFSHVQHFNVPQLSDSELSQVWNNSSSMAKAFELGTQDFKDLLRWPFNLYLLSMVVRPGENESSVGQIANQIELLEKHWAYRVESNPDNQYRPRIRAIRAVASTMVKHRQLFVADVDLDSNDDAPLNQLQQSGFLTEHGRYSDRVAFAHHMLFDYAVARTLILSEDRAQIIKSLQLSDDEALLLAPAALLALRSLWVSSSSKEVFWNIALALAESEQTGSYARMLPARLAAEVITTPEDVSFLLDAPPSVSIGHDAHRFILRHIYGTLLANAVPGIPKLGDPSDPWCQITRQVAEQYLPDLVWPLKAVIHNWIEKIGELTTTQATDLGVSARLLFSAQLETQHYDSGAMAAAIQGTARTYATSAAHSYTLFERILDPIRVEKFGHVELFRLGMEAKYLMAEAPEVVRLIYLATYNAPLPGEEESFLSESRILSLRSTKRQDIEGAQYLLEEFLPKFLLSSPSIAIQTISEILDYRIPLEHAYGFRPGTANEINWGDTTTPLMEDSSCIWWSSERRYNRGLPRLLDKIEESLEAAVDAANSTLLADIVDHARREIKWACFWSLLMKVDTAKPGSLVTFTLPLLKSTAVLELLSTRHAATELLHASYEKLELAEKSKVEEAIWAVSDKAQIRVLLGGLNSDSLVLSRSRLRKKRLERIHDISPNRPPFEIRSYAGDSDWWLKSQGVDTTTDDFKVLKMQIEALAITRGDNESDNMRAAKETWPKVLALSCEIRSKDVPHSLAEKAWDQIAETADRAALACTNIDDLSNFEEIIPLALHCLSDEFGPAKTYNEEIEKEFAKGPSWGRPAPRVEGATALMAIARAHPAPLPNEIAEKIKELARDPSPVIRHTVLARTNFVSKAHSELFHFLVDTALVEEQNVAVLGFFLNSVHRLLKKIDLKNHEQILELEARFEQSGEERRTFRDQLVATVIELWLACDYEPAKGRIWTWIKDPVTHKGSLIRALSYLRSALTIGAMGDVSSREFIVRSRTVQIYNEIISATQEAFQKRRVAQVTDDSLSRLLQVFDAATREIYFGSGAHSAKKEGRYETESLPDVEMRVRFMDEMRPAFAILATVPYPSITHYLLEAIEEYIPYAPEESIRLVITTIRCGGSQGGYQLESLGADLLVRLIRRILADYSAVVSSSEEFRTGLVKALDVFAEAGWPEARQLAYQLPEMLR